LTQSFFGHVCIYTSCGKINFQIQIPAGDYQLTKKAT